jgi:hypothetical protein
MFGVCAIQRIQCKQLLLDREWFNYSRYRRGVKALELYKCKVRSFGVAVTKN